MSPPRLSTGSNSLSTRNIVPGLDVDRSRLAAIRPLAEVIPRNDVRVIEAKACRLGNEGDPSHPVRGYEWRALLGCAIHVDKHHLTALNCATSPIEGCETIAVAALRVRESGGICRDGFWSRERGSRLACRGDER
jgi:hypothetical protein